MDSEVIETILQFVDLQELCQPGGRPRLATVEKWARDQGVRYLYDGRGGIWTTIDALNVALGVALPGNVDNKLRPDEVFR